MVGFSFVEGNAQGHAYLFDSGKMQDLGTFGWDHGFGFEINDHGEIAGRTDMGPHNAPTAVRAVFSREPAGWGAA